MGESPARLRNCAWQDWRAVRSAFTPYLRKFAHRRKEYYEILESTQKGELAVTEWLIWFLNCLRRAIEKANDLTTTVLEKDIFWQRLREGSIAVTERQQELLNRLLDGFGGKLTTEKWAKIKKISHDSALRDIQSLIEKGILKQSTGRTKGAAYSLAQQNKLI